MEFYEGTAPEFAAVLYKPGDIVGFCAAVASLVPPAFLIAHLAIFLCRREAQDLWFSIGQVVCEGSNKVIKHIIAEPRPKSPVSNMPIDSYGMPSAHSQFMGYVLGYTHVEVLLSTTALHERVTHFLLVLVLTAAVGFSRWYLWYHSAAQVLAGIGSGYCLGSVWYLVSVPLRKWGVVNWLLGLWPCRLFKVKDTQYDVTREWQEWKKKQS